MVYERLPERAGAFLILFILWEILLSFEGSYIAAGLRIDCRI